ncbi:MAG: PAS domain S-box protein [Pseudomonadota bacterium]
MPKSVSEVRLDSLLNTAVDGIILIDDGMRILVFNSACEELFGYAADDVIGQNVSLLMPLEYAQEHDAYVNNYMETGERRIIGIGREVRGIHRDGTEFPIELSVGEALTPAGRQFVGIVRDLRPRKAVERRLNQLQAELVHLARVSAMDEMGSAIAHELNQPLTAVMLYLQAVGRRMQALNGDGPNDPMLLETIDKAKREAERAGNIIQRMRHFVEKREPDRRAIELQPLINETLELTRVGTNSEGIQVDTKVDSDLSTIDADPVQLQQILVNLLRNAFEAVRGSSSPRVDITAREDANNVTIYVKDSGPGIPAEVHQRLFKAFSTSKRTGMGLGLSISRSIAQNHGGDLTVDPGGKQADGTVQGACFMLTLPRTEPEAFPELDANKARPSAAQLDDMLVSTFEDETTGGH